jgi:hexosaminidase
MKRFESVGVIIWFSFVCLGSAAAARSAPVPAVIPQPVSMRVAKGAFEIGSATRVVAAGPAGVEAAKLIDALAPAMGFRLRLVEGKGGPNTIVLSLDASEKEKFGAEGYRIDVTPERIDVRAVEPAGLFYGIQTLRQLLPTDVFRRKKVEGVKWSVPCVKVTDYPRFAWRGLLVDPARHFIPKEDMLRFIDTMAAHKFNSLQVHLTDKQGWRIEIRKYPKLTAIGSKMDRSRRKTKDGQYVGGFYTQDDVREIVRYAADRHITIVPEIGMPAHTGAAIVAYPELGVNTGHLANLPPEQRWGKTKSLIAPSPKTVAFFQDVLGEVIELFPSKYIHIGGDEARVGHWAGDPKMQAQMKRLKLKNAHELQSWFLKQMDAFLTNSGRRLIGWDEILQGGLAPGATVMSWRGTSGGIAAAKAGHDVVMAPTSHTYFDYRQAPRETGFGRSVIDLRKVYAFEPIPAELDAEQAKHVLGGQAQLWGEKIRDRRRREFMAFPRACALSEVLWSPKESRRIDPFLLRLDKHLNRLEAAGVNYRRLAKK